jgi:hypothetical protein
VPPFFDPRFPHLPPSPPLASSAHPSHHWLPEHHHRWESLSRRLSFAARHRHAHSVRAHRSKHARRHPFATLVLPVKTAPRSGHHRTIGRRATVPARCAPAWAGRLWWLVGRAVEMGRPAPVPRATVPDGLRQAGLRPTLCKSFNLYFRID